MGILVEEKGVEILVLFVRWTFKEGVEAEDIEEMFWSKRISSQSLEKETIYVHTKIKTALYPLGRTT